MAPRYGEDFKRQAVELLARIA